MAHITLKAMEFFAHHGCFAEERITGNKFLVDVTFETNVKQATQSDNLHHTIDYQEVYNVIRREMMQPSALLEHVVYRIIIAIQQNFPTIIETTVSVQKLNPALGGTINSVGFTLSSNEC